ncbi:hypothetical protein BRD01_04400 [Halobacteriales archaeon QS_8_65_32]|nr:MAG: hypothetical protein BRD01_04400 [Halobacteriales archaeon QS_8_65_32]
MPLRSFYIYLCPRVGKVILGPADRLLKHFRELWIFEASRRTLSQEGATQGDIESVADRLSEVEDHQREIVDMIDRLPEG